MLFKNTIQTIFPNIHIMRVPGEMTISFQGREQRMLISSGWIRRAIDQTLSVESRDDDATINGLSAWHAKPTMAN